MPPPTVVWRPHTSIKSGWPALHLRETCAALRAPKRLWRAFYDRQPTRAYFSVVEVVARLWSAIRGGENVQISYTALIAIATFPVVLLAIGVYLATRLRGSKTPSKKQASEQRALDVETELTLDPLTPKLVGRIGIVEGELAAMKSQMEQLGSLSVKVTNLEVQLPTIADAYEKYTSALDRLNKRQQTRDQRSAQRMETAADANGLLDGIPTAAEAQKILANNGEQQPNRRAGIVGRGRT